MIADLFQEFFNNYATYEYPLASSQLFLAMLGMGALLTPADFLLEVRKPKGLVIGLTFQWLLVPAIAVVLGIVMPVPAGIAVGLILVASVPGGTMSNILTLFGRGNIALSITLTSLTTVAALITTPLLLRVLLSQHLAEDFSMPTARIALDIFFTLIVPLVIGMLVRSRITTFYAAQFSKMAIRLSMLMILLMVVGASGSGRLSGDSYGLEAVVTLVVFCLTIQVVGVLITRMLGMSTRDGLAIVVEAAFRNVSLAVAVKAVVFPAQPGTLDPIGDAALFVALLYGGISMFMTLIPVLVHRKFPVEEVSDGELRPAD